MAGVYIHIPFCRKACIYCDFHFSTVLRYKADFVKALLKEMRLRKEYLNGEPVETIYFGGGTPSVLEQAELIFIMQAVYQNFNVKADAEITFEANPDDLSKEKLKELSDAGVNRLSIGLQSFNEEELKWMNRTHTVLQNESCVIDAQELGFSNISVDLIYGSRFSTMADWESSLKKVESFNIQHLSCYNLTVEEKTELGHRVRKGKEKNTDEQLSAQQFEWLMNWSTPSEFEQYEISNFARNGFYSKHNSAYWFGKKYAGFGPGAHSYNGHSRQWNISNNAQYIQKVETGENFSEAEQLDDRMKLNEYLLTNLRTKWGIDVNFIEQNFPDKFLFLVRKQIQIETESGNLLQNGSIITLTRQGTLLGDEVTRNLMV